jgi:ribosomal protein RSM22 (predicted rRNA methylase)
MELPPALRAAVDRALSGRSAAELAKTAAALSRRYRDERRDGRLHVASDDEALAYLAVRLPATYAAVRASLAAIAQARPDFAPSTALDIGSGPGTALWAAADCWPALADALLVEASPAFRACGEALARDARLPRATWRTADITSADVTTTALDGAPRDLVTLAYVLNELAPEARPALLRRLWQATADTLLIVEPGTLAGWQRIIAARAALIEAGAHVLAPCPHAHACPLAHVPQKACPGLDPVWRPVFRKGHATTSTPPDWCYFAVRVARSRLHRLAKEAELSWEDEKFSYLAVSRRPSPAAAARVVARPRKASGRVTPSCAGRTARPASNCSRAATDKPSSAPGGAVGVRPSKA